MDSVAEGEDLDVVQGAVNQLEEGVEQPDEVPYSIQVDQPAIGP